MSIIPKQREEGDQGAYIIAKQVHRTEITNRSPNPQTATPNSTINKHAKTVLKIPSTSLPTSHLSFSFPPCSQIYIVIKKSAKLHDTSNATSAITA
jgi:hypothetical protein